MCMILVSNIVFFGVHCLFKEQIAMMQAILTDIIPKNLHQQVLAILNRFMDVTELFTKC